MIWSFIPEGFENKYVLQLMKELSRLEYHDSISLVDKTISISVSIDIGLIAIFTFQFKDLNFKRILSLINSNYL